MYKISPWRLALYALVLIAGTLVAIPSFLPRELGARLPAPWSDLRVALGLDLRGGASITLRADDRDIARDLTADFQARLSDALEERARGSVKLESDERSITLTVARGFTVSAVLTTIEEIMPTFRRSSSGPDAPAYTVRAEGEIVYLALRDEALEQARSEAVVRSIEVVRLRVDEAGVAEPSIQRLGEDRILVQMPGVNDTGALRTLLGSTAELSFHRVASDSGEGQATPVGYRRLPSADEAFTALVETTPVLAGERLADASTGFSAESGAPVVQFRFDREGARLFGELTEEVVGEPLAIVLDGQVLSTPTVNEPIRGGSGEISGGFTVEEASTLATLLRAGALPIPLEVIEERVVGADLGHDAIERGVVTGLAGFALVAATMIALYGVWGVVASTALMLNVALTVAALALLGATLTLPGIAGIILGMGLAVDANVLINERIREETRAGCRAGTAMQAGFERAYRAIVDSNLTTLIATALLFWVGSGPVRGFAVTMGLGIAISLFTAVTVVRSAMYLHLRVNRPRTFVIGSLLPWLESGAAPAFRFMRGRFLGLGVSLVLSAASLALFVSPGLDYGVDFRGGTLIEARFEEPAELATLRTALERLELGEVSLQESEGARQISIRVEEQPGGESAQSRAAEAVRDAVSEIESDASFERVDIVGPRVSDELVSGGILAVVAASLAMLVYIWARFDWPFAVGAIVTLGLDVTKTLGFFALTGLDFGLTAIAALLTLIGYSVNDKVVVYDRMRENMAHLPAMPFQELIDLSINQTLARSLYTSATALAAMLPMAIWGGNAVQSFAIPMVFGIVVAASSSVFIAAPILLFLGDWRERRRRSSAPALAPGVGAS